MICKQPNCGKEYSEDGTHLIKIDLEENTFLTCKFPVTKGKDSLPLCETCLQKGFQEWFNGLNEVQKEFVRDQSNKEAVEKMVLSVPKETG